MIVETDDELYRVDRTYLGPKGRRMPWRATYRAYAVWFAIALSAGTIIFWIGVPVTLLNILLLLFGSVWSTIHVMKRLDYDRPLITLPIVAWHELSAPRPDRARRVNRHSIALRAKRWPAGSKPRWPWWMRLPRIGRRRNDEVDGVRI